MKMKKQVAVVASFLMIFGLLNLWPAQSIPKAHAADAGWPASVLSGLNMPFRPTDSLVTTQNPPDFSWPFITGSDGYDLQVSRNASMADPVYENSSLSTNFYNFPQVFDAGTWYWQVRYHMPATGWSEWSTVRRFRISEQNVPFPVPPVDELMNRVETAHPRIWTNPSELAAFRNLRLSGNGKAVFDRTQASVMANLNKLLPAEPTFPYSDGSVAKDSPEYVAAQNKLRNYSEEALGRMMDAAFVYLITGDAAVGANAKAQLLNFSTWDPFGATSFENQDQVHRAIAYQSAMAYDWLYDLLSPSEKQQIQNMVRIRTNTLVQKFVINQPIFRNPYDSHGWTIFGYIGLIGTAMLHDIPEAADWFRQTVPAYINILPPWGGEDGSWSQGTGYWQWSSSSNKELMDVLLSAGAINLYDKAYSRNEGQYPLYMFPHGSPTGVFGNDSHYTPDWPSVTLLNRLAQMYGDARLKWESDAIGVPPSSGLQDYFYGDENLATRPPVDLPKGKWFPDTGFVAMHSDLYDRDRTSLYFRSSPYGSYSHVQADQNSFIIHAFGEPLAIKSGFYDYYDSNHHKNFTKQTFSANAITFDGRKGQPADNIDADGKILGFATSTDFDAVTGDASAAYKGNLTKAVRHIIYVRPSVYVVIDDLATDKAGGSEFEWNLHTDDQLTFDASGAGATVLKGDAGLRVQFYGAQAQNYRTTYETKFLSAAGVEVPPGGSFAGRNQIHAQFITNKTNAAKMVSTLEPYKRGSTPQTVASAEYADYMKLTFADGTAVYVRKTDGGLIDTGADGYRFDAAAIAVRGNSILLVNGTKVEKGGVTLVQSDVPSTVAYGKEQLSVSSVADAQISLQTSGVAKLRDRDNGAEIPSGGSVAEGMNIRGTQWTTEGNVLTMHVEKGQRAFRLNEAPIPGPLDPVVLQTEIDGVPGQVTLQAYRDSEGVSVAWGKLANAAGFYEVLEAPKGFTFEKYGRINSGLLDAKAPVLLKGATGLLKLKSIGAGDATPSVVIDDPEQAHNTLSMDWQEAESFVQWGNKAPNVYSTRPFLSGGKGVAAWDQTGQWLKWKFNVPKSGTYDLVLKYVAGWDLPQGQTMSVRYLKIGDKISYFEAPKTFDFGTKPEYWKGLRVKTGQQLSAGPVEITMWHQLGGMNLDWLGLVEVKDDEIRPTVPGNIGLDSQTDDSATVSWDASTDNVAVKEYAIYLDGVKRMTVPAGTNTATVSGLTMEKTYEVTVRAVDTSDNLSLTSKSVTVKLVDRTPPVWGETTALRAAAVFTNAVKLVWDPATDTSGSAAEYAIYRKDGSAYVPAGTSNGTSFDAADLQPGATYTFKVEAKDVQGNLSANGPEVTVTLPLTSRAFYDSFTSWPVGETADGNGWSYIKSNGTSVQTVPLADLGGNGLQAVDNYQSSADEYAVGPTLMRTFPNYGGKVSVETRTMFSKLNHPIGNYTMDLAGNGKSFAAFIGFSDGGIGYEKVVNGSYTNVRMTDYNIYKQPADQWMTLRFDLDFDAKTYDLMVQADGLKTYAGAVDPTGTLDRSTGVYTVKGIPFHSSLVKGLEMFRMKAQRFTGKYTFDSLAVYNTVPAPGIRISAKPVVNPGEVFPVSVGVENVNGAMYQEAELSYDPNRFTFMSAEPAMAGTQIVKAENDERHGVVRITALNDSPLSGSRDLLRLLFRAKREEASGKIGVNSARIGSSDADAAAVNGLPTKTVKVFYTGAPDHTPPVTTDDAPENGIFNADLTVRLTAVDGGEGVADTKYTLDGSEPQTGLSIVIAGEGKHTITYWSEDYAGNAEPPHTRTIIIDKTASVTEASLSPAAPDGSNGWYKSPVTVSLSATDQGSGVRNTEYRINNGDWTAYNGSIPTFRDGIYQVDYRSADLAGNFEEIRTLHFKIDETAPELSVQLDKTELWPPNHKMADIHATFTTNDGTSGVSSIELTSITSNEPDSGDGDIEAELGTAADSFRLRAERTGEGTGRIYTITYTITDNAGNQSTAVSTVMVPHDK